MEVVVGGVEGGKGKGLVDSCVVVEVEVELLGGGVGRSSKRGGTRKVRSVLGRLFVVFSLLLRAVLTWRVRRSSLGGTGGGGGKGKPSSKTCEWGRDE